MQMYTVKFNETEYQANGGTFYHSGVTLEFNDWLDETTAEYTVQVEDWAMSSFEQYLNARDDVISWERGPITKDSPRYQFAQTYPDGEVYAVRYHEDGHGTITGVCGPLAFREVKAQELPQYDYEDSDLIAWFSSGMKADGSSPTIVPLSDEQVRNIEQQSEDMSHHA